MIQHSTVTYRVVLEYDDEQMTEHEAQQTALEAFPEQLGRLLPLTADSELSNRSMVGIVKVHFVERTEGGVDRDGIPTQPKARRP